MRRDIFTSDHDAFRDAVRSFIAKEVAPYHEQWERDGLVSCDAWLAAGEAGLLGIDMAERFGGGGNDDYRCYLVLNEEMTRAGAHGPGFSVHNDIDRARRGPGFHRQGGPRAQRRPALQRGRLDGQVVGHRAL